MISEAKAQLDQRDQKLIRELILDMMIMISMDKIQNSTVLIQNKRKILENTQLTIKEVKKVISLEDLTRIKQTEEVKKVVNMEVQISMKDQARKVIDIEDQR